MLKRTFVIFQVLLSNQMTEFSANSLPGCAALFPKTPEEIKEVVSRAKSAATDSLEKIYAQEGERTFLNTARAADLAQTNLAVSSSLISTMKNLGVSKDLRDASNEAVVELQAFSIDAFETNRKLYSALKEYINATKEKASHSEQQAYWLEQTMLEYKRMGLELEGEKFDLVVSLQKKISELSTSFSKNIADDTSSITVTLEELKGVPEHIVKMQKEAEDGKKILKMDYPTYFGVMKNCEVASTRLQMGSAFENRAFPQNMNILHEVIETRHQMSNLLSFDNFAEYDLSNKMAKSPEIASAFIKDLIPRLQNKWSSEREMLISKGLHESVKVDGNGNIPWYDVAFVMDQFKRKHLNIDETLIQEYFPMESTISALLDVYEKFFDLKFEKSENSGFWHESVIALSVKDNRKDGELLGHILLDLYPREGKFTHAACGGIVPPVKQEDGSFTPALVMVMANFPAATPDRPALLTHGDAETFFHEFGHAIHYMMGRPEMASVAGYHVKMDFVELPSQMLEEWMWNKDILKKVTSHYKEKNQLPDELIDAKIAAKNAFSGRDTLRQLQFATLSLRIFDSDFGAKKASEMDSTQLVNDVKKEIMTGIIESGDGHFQCSFGHLMGYGSCYYGYMWSKVFALDAFTYIEDNGGLLSPVMGRRYIEHIIGLGGGKDPNAMLEGFLARKPSSDAFLKNLGI